jgi:hypothetical protein
MERRYHVSIAQSVTPIGGRRNVKVKRLCSLEIARRIFWKDRLNASAPQLAKGKRATAPVAAQAGRSAVLIL